MRSVFSIYNFGALILFFGLLWMFLSHAVHENVINQSEETSHVFHIFQGLILVLIGLFVMIKDDLIESKLSLIKRRTIADG